jgi:hypothetical protein
MTRVRKNVPPFTLRLSEAFVNGKTRVSTGFLRFFLAFLWKTRLFRGFCAGEGSQKGVFRGFRQNSAQCARRYDTGYSPATD